MYYCYLRIKNFPHPQALIIIFTTEQPPTNNNTNNNNNNNNGNYNRNDYIRQWYYILDI